MSSKTLANGFSDLAVPVVDGGTNDADTLSLAFNGQDQGAKGTIETTGAAGAITAWVRVNDASRGDTFRLRPRVSGYKALPVALTIDGVTVQPSIRLEGEDASAGTWTATAGDDMVETGAAAAVEYDELAPGIDCKRVKFAGGNWFQNASAQADQIGTDDFALEFIYTHTTDAVELITNSFGTVVSTTGATLVLSFGGSPSVTLVSGLIAGATYHVMVFADRSANVSCYANATAGTAVSIAAASAQNISGKWAVGARVDTGASPYTGGISYFSLWHSPAWLFSSTQAGVAAERFARCCGTYAETAAQLNPGFADLDMELAGTSAWTPGGGAALSKETGARTGGSGALILRVTGDGVTSAARAVQVVAGGITRVTGWSRSNGTAIPNLYLSGFGVWQGTTSTNWQYFDITVRTAYYSFTQLWLGVAGVTSGYSEWDDITVEVDGAIPTTSTRSTIAHLEKWNAAETEGYLIPVGPNWIRTDKVKTQNGTFKTGARIENGQTNRFLYSEDFDNAAWTKLRATIGTPVVGLGSLSFDAIIASNHSQTHILTQAVTTAASESHAVSVYAKAGAVNSIRIELNEAPTQFAHYNLATGVVGDVGAGFTLSQPAHMYDMGDGYYRCEFRPTTAGVTGTINIYPSNGSVAGGETFTGDNTTPSVYLAGAQFERHPGSSQQSGSLTSYIKTTTAAVTRVKDILTFHGYENCRSASAKNITAKVDYVCPAFVSGYTGFRNFGALGAKTANDRTELYRNATTDKAVALVTVNSASQALLASATAPLLNGNAQVIEACFAQDSINIVLGREIDATDTSADLPGLLEIVVGASTTYLYQLDGLVTDFLLSPHGTVYPRAIFALDKPAHTQSAFVGYDTMDEDALACELRAGAGTGHGVTMNGGNLSAGTWYLVSLEWSGGTAISLRVDGALTASAVADATIAALTQLFLAWCYSREV